MQGKKTPVKYLTNLSDYHAEKLNMKAKQG